MTEELLKCDVCHLQFPKAELLVVHRYQVDPDGNRSLDIYAACAGCNPVIQP